MRQAKFSIESFGSQTFDGYTLDETWNGWVCPYFTYEEALKIVEAQKNASGEAWYEKETDQFVFVFQEESETFSSVKIENLKLYPVGSGSWIWDEVKTSIAIV